MSSVNVKAKRGIKLLMARQVIVQIITFAGGVVLARILSPTDFGLYAIATFLVHTFALFGDFGLAPSLIQRKTELSEHDLQVGFTVQQIFTTIVVIALLVSAPWLVMLYPKAPPETLWLVRSLAVSLYLTSWRTISALQLERHLSYDRLARVEVVENLSFQGIAVVLAIMGFGVWSFVWATLVRGILGTVCLWAAAPWKARFAFDRTIAVDILKFGIPFQATRLLNNVGNWVGPLVVGSYIGSHAVGYLTWAGGLGKKPLMFVESSMRVSFPHFSRIQDDPEEVERVMVRYLTYLLLPAGAWTAVIIAAANPIVEWVYTAKWSPAVPALCLYAAAVSLDVISWVISSTVAALGHAGKLAVRNAGRTAAQILLGIPLVLLVGFEGVPIAYLIVMAASMPWLSYGLPSHMVPRALRAVAWLIIPAAAGAAIGRSCLLIHTSVVIHAILGTVVALAVFAIAAWLSCPDWLKAGVLGRLRRFRRLGDALATTVR